MSELTIGRYEIREEIGEGGMGTVYRAYDPTLGREVALKVLQPQLYREDAQFSMRFEREAKTIAALEHSSIVALYDFGEDGEWVYIVMRLMEGGTLGERLEQGPISLEATIDIVRRIGSALDKAHSRGIVHRDLKPGNILFDEDGEAFLSDFGIVKADDATGLKTRTGQALGTPQYMSPEQLEGEEVDGRSDIYSLGIILYEMLSGSRPYEAKSTARIIVLQLTAPVPSIVEADPGLAPGLDTVIKKAMAKEPAERYGTAGEMTEALKGVAAKQSADNAAVVVTAAAESIPEAEPPAKILVEPFPVAAQVTPTPETKPPDNVVEQPSLPVAEAQKKGGLPGWMWWVGAAAVVLLLIFGIRAMFRGGGDEAQESTEESEDAIAVVVSTATVTGTAVPPTSTATSTPEPANTATAVPSPTAALDPNVSPPDPTLGSVRERPQDKMKMVYVPPGTFPMGSSDGAANEQPIHDVTLDGFWIDETEVTNAHYSQCEDAGECEASDYANDSTYNADDYPVMGVSWDDADAYCGWVGGQLPTEAEWEYAARGPEGLGYPWGEDFDGEKANYCDKNCEFDRRDEEYDDEHALTAPVGSFPEVASWAGALDMAGNVWEWVNDWYDGEYYAGGAAENPTGPESGEWKVLRGGSWTSISGDLRSALRRANLPGSRKGVIGFRCVSPGG